ncbi:MAG TPA: DUF2970 domain-containing protein [Gammaproteobacteria bacterium]|nr:DUF2970 domain-containing protein [Gammaproteobacteria bacterium]
MVEENQDVGFMQVVKSVLSGMFGVQSSKNRERDFTKGKPIHYVVVGLLFTAMFILTLVGVVKLVLHFTGV